MKEIWKDIPGYEGFYQVSNYGKIKNIKLNKHRKQRKDKDGYLIVDLFYNKPKTFKIHRLVALSFIPNPNNLSQINHIDGNKINNCDNNLEWCTPSSNSKHRIYTLNKNSLYPCKKIKCIELDKEFESIGEGARFIGCTQSSLSRVISKSNYTCGGYHWIFL